MPMAAASVNCHISRFGHTTMVVTPVKCGLLCQMRFRGIDSQSRTFKSSRLSCFTVNNSARVPVPLLQDESYGDHVPTPVVVIDQDSDPAATVVEITFGDRLGALLDTMKALRDLGLNVVKGIVAIDSSGIHNKFSITRADTGRKVEDPELLEAIRLTVINNLLKYHPESSARLAMGEAFGIIPPIEKPDVDIATHINIYNDNPKRSLLCIETADRPGLLMEVVKAIADINVSVESGEFDTEGLLAKAKFHVSYHGSSLSDSLKEVLINSLRYFLRRPSTEESSF